MPRWHENVDFISLLHLWLRPIRQANRYICWVRSDIQPANMRWNGFLLVSFRCYVVVQLTVKIARARDSRWYTAATWPPSRWRVRFPTLFDYKTFYQSSHGSVYILRSVECRTPNRLTAIGFFYYCLYGRQMMSFMAASKTRLMDRLHDRHPTPTTIAVPQPHSKGQHKTYQMLFIQYCNNDGLVARVVLDFNFIRNGNIFIQKF